jgi:ABC-type glycerol-3-phosphate transport system substrate-binding protein
LDAYAGKYGWTKKMQTSVLDRARYAGKQYGVPRSSEAVGLFYNTAIFAKYRIPAPTTYPAFLAAADRLMAAGVTPKSRGEGPSGVAA